MSHFNTLEDAINSKYWTPLRLIGSTKNILDFIEDKNSYKELKESKEKLKEYIESNKLEPYTAGFIKEDGTLIVADEYEYSSHYGIAEDNPEIVSKNYPEFSNTHPEEDTCIRLSLDNEPNAVQYKKLEEIIDYYLDHENYCKAEIWGNNKPVFYKVYSLVEGACGDYSWEETLGNWSGYKIVSIIKNFYANPENNKLGLTESLLLEKKRSELISKSKSGAEYKSDKSKGRNRWERRVHSKLSTSVADYNQIDMNTFWKEDLLEFGIKVQGETDNYVVTVTFEKVLERLRREIEQNNNKLEFKNVLRALINTFNSEDVYVACSCPDFTYGGFNHYSYRQGYNSNPEFGPAMDAPVIRNPADNLGAGCKHINLVLANLSWMMKIASVINNYIWYCKDNMELNYGKYIFPKLYGMDYEKAVQLVLSDYDENGELNPNLATDEATINLSNAIGRRRTQYKTKPEPSVNPRFERTRKPEPEKNPLKLQFNDEEEVNEEPRIYEPESEEER